MITEGMRSIWSNSRSRKTPLSSIAWHLPCVNGKVGFQTWSLAGCAVDETSIRAAQVLLEVVSVWVKYGIAASVCIREAVGARRMQRQRPRVAPGTQQAAGGETRQAQKYLNIYTLYRV